jgi:CAAX prenyl protease-like protein
MALLALMPALELPPVWDQAVRLLVVGGVLALVSRPVLDFRVRRAFASVLLGVAVFVVWIAPDVLAPSWRTGILFSNDIVGRPESGFPEAARGNGLAIALRFARAALLVPIIEELFWRGWLPRIIMDSDFRRVPLGSFTPAAFIITAVLFATEHGSWWDVGLLAGLAYNWWMLRTRSLGDLMLAHAVTNACLSAWVIGAGRWEYW